MTLLRFLGLTLFILFLSYIGYQRGQIERLKADLEFLGSYRVLDYNEAAEQGEGIEIIKQMRGE